MAKKVNPYLAKLEAREHAKYMKQLRLNSEIDQLALMLMVHDRFQVGHGRAMDTLNEFRDIVMQIAGDIIDDSDADRDVLHTKADLAGAMAEIFGPDWKEAQHAFTFLRDYWTDGDEHGSD